MDWSRRKWFLSDNIFSVGLWERAIHGTTNFMTDDSITWRKPNAMARFGIRINWFHMASKTKLNTLLVNGNYRFSATSTPLTSINSRGMDFDQLWNFTDLEWNTCGKRLIFFQMPRDDAHAQVLQWGLLMGSANSWSDGYAFDMHITNS